MRFAIPAALLLLALATYGSLAVSGGYAWYWRSDAYRKYCAAVLSRELRMPSAIGPIYPRSSDSREFTDVVVYLPDRRDEVLTCRSAIIRATPTADNAEAYEIHVRGGICEISSRTWLRSDYRFVVEAGLRPGFDPDGPRRIVFADMEVKFEREQFSAALRGAIGEIHFVNHEHATVNVRCDELNGHKVAEAVTLKAAFSPREQGVRIDRLDITVPSMPLEVLRLGQLLRGAPRSGRFDGAMAYIERDDGRHIELRGKCYDLQLAELTSNLTPLPWRGRCPEIELQSLSVHERQVRAARFSGALTGVMLEDVLAPLGLQAFGGATELRVREAILSQAGVERLAASGTCEQISIAVLSRGVGRGEATGTARIVIDDLLIEKNRLLRLDARLLVEPAGDEPNWIEGRLVQQIAEQALKIKLPPALPARVPYTRLGVRIEVREEKLRVHGTYGPGGSTMMTLRVLGFDVPIGEPQAAFDLSPHLDAARTAAFSAAQRALHEFTPQKAWEYWRLPYGPLMPLPTTAPAPGGHE